MTSSQRNKVRDRLETGVPVPLHELYGNKVASLAGPSLRLATESRSGRDEGVKTTVGSVSGDLSGQTRDSELYRRVQEWRRETDRERLADNGRIKELEG